MGLFGEIGLEPFCYYLADSLDLIDELLERNTLVALVTLSKWARPP